MATEQDKQRYQEARVVAFQHGLDAWREATAATGIEPAVAVHDNGSGR